MAIMRVIHLNLLEMTEELLVIGNSGRIHDNIVCNELNGSTSVEAALNTPQKARQDGFCIIVAMMIRHVIFGI